MQLKTLNLQQLIRPRGRLLRFFRREYKFYNLNSFFIFEIFAAASIHSFLEGNVLESMVIFRARSILSQKMVGSFNYLKLQYNENV